MSAAEDPWLATQSDLTYRRLAPRLEEAFRRERKRSPARYAAFDARLRRECDRLRMERDILKKSISIFAGPLR